MPLAQTQSLTAAPAIPPGKANLAAVNATLNATSTLLLVAGLVMIKRRKPIIHQYLMLAALTVSAVFLICYLTSYFVFGEVSSKVAGKSAPGWARIFYAVVLIPHLLAAIGMLPLIAKALYHAAKGEFDKHRRIAKPTWFIWFYVSASGVLVYWMLYHWLPSFAA